MTFHVATTTDNSPKVVPGMEVVHVLRKKLHSNEDLFDFKVTKINTLGKWALVDLLSYCMCIYHSRNLVFTKVMRFNNDYKLHSY